MYFVLEIYYTNSQYYVRLDHSDEDDVGGECTCVISLLKKHLPPKSHTQSLNIGLDIHLVSIRGAGLTFKDLLELNVGN